MSVYLKKRVSTGVLLLLCLLLGACDSLANVPDARVRTYATVVDDTLELSVTLEGADGQSLSGAMVGLTDPAGAWQAVPFSMNKGAYTLSVAALAGTYRLELDSAAAGRRTVSFPVTLLAARPEIILIQDGLGNDATAFEELKASAPIRLEWRETEGAARYLVEARQSGVTRYSAVVETTSVLLPEQIFEAALGGAPATVQITAAAQAGDPQFEEADYLSSSSLAGRSFTFQVVP